MGDGIFPLRKFQNYGGKWSIGTDSHIGLNPFEELRILDYGQRLISHKRNTFYSEKQGDAGQFAVEMTVTTGRKAMHNYNSAYFVEGLPFNGVLIDATSPLIKSTSLPNLLSTILYASDSKMQYGTIANGVLVVKNGKHYKIDAISKQFLGTISKLNNR